MMTLTRPRTGRPQSFSDEQVFRAILEIVIDRGIESVTMPAIAKRIGFSHQAVTYRFATRENLLLAFGAWHVGKLEKVQARLQAQNGDSLAALIWFFSGGANAELVELPDLVNPGEPLKLMIEFDRDPVLRRFFARSREQTLRWITSQVERAQSEGDIGQDHPARDVAEALLFAASGAVVIHAYDAADVLGEHLERAVLRAISPYRS